MGFIVRARNHFSLLFLLFQESLFPYYLLKVYEFYSKQFIEHREATKKKVKKKHDKLRITLFLFWEAQKYTSCKVLKD